MLNETKPTDKITKLQAIPLLRPIYTCNKRYVVLYGGRGGGKSFELARSIILRLRSSEKPMRVLCCREIQKSIKESVYFLLAQAVYDLGLTHLFEILSTGIRRRYSDGRCSEIFFSGIRNNIYEIKSMADIDICWVEEAGNVSQYSWDILLPTVRKQNSQIFISFNPTTEDSPTHRLFLSDNIPEEDLLRIKINYWDNPFISQTLLNEMERMKKEDYERYLHHWEGLPLAISNAAVFKNKFKVEAINILTLSEIDYMHNKKIEYKYGMDFGFSTDPFACVECFIHGECIYITREIYWHNMENMDIVPVIKQKMPELVKNRRKIYADSAYPATISQLAKVQIHPSGEQLESLNIQGAVKGAGSVEEGINWLKSYQIIIDPSCKNTIFEFNNYCYMTDKDTGEIIPKVEDKNNHCLTGDTLIHTNKGLIAIENLLNTSILVWAYDNITKKYSLCKGKNIRITAFNAETIKLTFDYDSYNYVTCTKDHLILTSDGWIEADKITNKHFVMQMLPNKDIAYVRLTNKTTDKFQTVYDMEVEQLHNFAINKGIIVHNCIDALRYAFNEEILASKSPGFKVYSSALATRNSKRTNKTHPLWR